MVAGEAVPPPTNAAYTEDVADLVIQFPVIG
jgi:hypothetical protein